MSQSLLEHGRTPVSFDGLSLDGDTMKKVLLMSLTMSLGEGLLAIVLSRSCH